ncbi:helix-turn-helix domain-containing protein [Lactobacillus gallinarum]|uniref:helix-turn-helix domain-containing protein n=1 Tax=Lactobacillus gallinarum TaxID=52242 RepID=UPI00248E0F3A|nr:helix-turn-helix transcriptional regulator [Lactobacillus gallinarum]
MNRLKEVRKEKGYTLAAVAIIAGIANNTLSQYETGKREPKLEMWQKLADIYGVSVPYLQGIDNEIYDLKFPTEQEAVDFIHEIMKAQNIKLEDIQNESYKGIKAKK